MALSALILMAFAANAQAPGQQPADSTASHNWGQGRFHRPYGAMRSMHRRDMRSHIMLSDTQKQQIKTINTDYQAKLKDLDQHDEVTLREYRQKKAALQQDRKSRIEAVFTPEQKQQIAQMRAQQKERREKMAQAHLMKMKSALNLSDDQVAKIQEQRKQTMEKAQSIRDNTTLTNDQKREAFRELMKSNREYMKNILTADQLKKEQELRKSRMHHPPMRREASAS